MSNPTIAGQGAISGFFVVRVRRLLSFAILLLPCTALTEQKITFSSPPPAHQVNSTNLSSSSSTIGRELEFIVHAFGGDDLQAYFGFVPEIVITDDALPNAFAKAPNRIEVSEGLVQVTQSAHELAFVVAHELAHHMLEHSVAYPAFADAPLPQPTAMMTWEHAADGVALKLLQGGGFDPYTAPELLDRLANHYQRILPASATPRHLRARAAHVLSVLANR